MTTELHNETLDWAAEWIEGSLKGEFNERVKEFGRNMAITFRAAKTVARVSANGVPAVNRAIYSELIHVAAELARGDGFLSTCAEDLNPRLKRADILKTAERQEERLKDWAYRVRQVADKLSRAASPVAPQQSDQRMFAPPAEDNLHIAICNAVQSDQFTASDILRQALIDYQPTKLTRTELIRVQQRSGSGEVTAIMVSRAATPLSSLTRKAAEEVFEHYIEEAPNRAELIASIQAVIERCLSEGEALTLDEVQE